MSARHEQRARDRELLDDLRRVAAVADPAPDVVVRVRRCPGCGLPETDADCFCRCPGSQVEP